MMSNHQMRPITLTCIWITASVWSSAVFAWASKTNGYLHMVTWESMTCTKQTPRDREREDVIVCSNITTAFTGMLAFFIIWNILQMIHHRTRMQITKQKQTYWSTKPCIHNKSYLCNQILYCEHGHIWMCAESKRYVYL